MTASIRASASHKDGPQAIAPSDKERQAGVYSPRNLQRVLGALHQDGLVVLENVIDKEHIDSLNAVMTADAEKYIADPKQEFNHNVKCELPRWAEVPPYWEANIRALMPVTRQRFPHWTRLVSIITTLCCP